MRPIDLLVVNLYPFEATVAQAADFRHQAAQSREARPDASVSALVRHASDAESMAQK
jgi:AICAR transformylase/IMP cyclohydrolase PurH